MPKSEGGLKSFWERIVSAPERRFNSCHWFRLGGTQSRSVTSDFGFLSGLRISVFGFIFCGLWAFSACADVPEAQLALKKFQVPSGFRAELVAAEPMFVNPVSFSIDSKGRFYVVETHRFNNSVFDITQNTNWLSRDLALRTVEDRSRLMTDLFATNLQVLTRNSERVRLIEDRDGDGVADHAETFAEGMNEITSGIAAGALANKDELWVGCIPDLLRFRLDKDGRPLSREKVHSGFGVHIGVTGHDLHGLALGPDGRVYFSIGDRGFHIVSKGKVLDYPDTGGVLRCNRDGSELEVFATGLRNPQELVFDQFGNLWAGDNDTAGEDKSRLIYVVEGGDYGWRCSYQHMKGFGPWVQEKVWEGRIDGMLPHSGEIAQGPAGFAQYPGTGLPSEYDGRFFMCDFPGGIWSFNVVQSGASYVATNRQKFLWNIFPTDAAFGPDGCFYVLDWVEGWVMPEKGRIYRLRYEAGQEDSTTRQVKELLAGGFERLSIPDLRKLLEHRDVRVRQGAQFALAAKGAEGIGPFMETARSSSSRLARIHALWGLGQLAKFWGDPPQNLIDRLLADGDAEIRAQTAKWLRTVPASSASKPLLVLLRDPEPRVRFFAAESLGRLRVNAAASELAAMLRENADRDAYLTHAGIQALLQIGDWKAIATAASSDSKALRRAALLCYRRAGRSEIRQFLEDADASVVLEAARAIYDAPVPSAMEKLAAKLETLPEKAVVRGLHANLRLGGSLRAQAVARIALNPARNLQARQEAVTILSLWDHPPEIDGVVGLWRPIPSRTRGEAEEAFASAFDKLLRDERLEIQLATLDAALQFKTPAIGAAALRFYQDGIASGTLRARVLKLLGSAAVLNTSEAAHSALQDHDPAVRLAGMQLLQKSRPPEAAEWIRAALETEHDLRVQQAAWQVIAKLPGSEGMIRQSMRGKVPALLALEIWEAATAQEITNLAFTTEMLLQGGDREEGRRIFQERQGVECLRCHTIKGQGGTVGPKLDGIAGGRDRAYLLESILEPNKQIAAGFENVVVAWKDGRNTAGVVSRETAEELELNSPEDGKVVIPKREITSQTRGLSAMPEGLAAQLSKRDLRDLVEFLASLR